MLETMALAGFRIYTCINGSCTDIVAIEPARLISQATLACSHNPKGTQLYILIPNLLRAV